MNITNNTKKELSPEQREELQGTLEERFEKNMQRHEGLEWSTVQVRLEANPEKFWLYITTEPILTMVPGGFEARYASRLWLDID